MNIPLLLSDLLSFIIKSHITAYDSLTKNIILSKWTYELEVEDYDDFDNYFVLGISSNNSNNIDIYVKEK